MRPLFLIFNQCLLPYSPKDKMAQVRKVAEATVMQ